MSLQPCRGCARHVRGDETVCPFCAAPVHRAETRPLLGRVSRAAVFAGALGGCWTSKAPAQPSSTTTEQGDFAKPPDGSQPAAAARVSIEGVVTDVNTGAPLAQVPVQLYRSAGHDIEPVENMQPVATDANGRYAFVDVPDGAYWVVVRAGSAARFPRQPVRVQSKVGVSRVDVAVQMQHPTSNPIPAPYGAPPARRRVV